MIFLNQDIWWQPVGLLSLLGVRLALSLWHGKQHGIEIPPPPLFLQIEVYSLAQSGGGRYP